MGSWEYTDEQKDIMDWGKEYGTQTAPTYEKDQKDLKRYNTGNDPKGKLTRFLTPYRVQAGVQREGMLEDYRNEMGGTQGGFAMSGAHVAAGSARLRRESLRDQGMAEVSAYVQRGEGLHDRVTGAFEAAKAREMAAQGLAAGIANNPHYKSTWGDFWKGLAQSAIAGGSQIASAAVGKV